VRCDAAHADDRNLHGTAAFIDHAPAIGLMAGSLRPPTMNRPVGGSDVDRHGEERVDERDRIGAGVWMRARTTTSVTFGVSLG
jgi:hypothetical protein